MTRRSYGSFSHFAFSHFAFSHLAYSSLPLVMLASCALTALPARSQAQTAAFGFSASATVYDYAVGTYKEMGYQFTTAAVIPVYGLGFYDSSVYLNKAKQGLNESHSVGIFSANTGALLVQGTVPAGTDGSLIGDFRYTDQLFDGSNKPLVGPFNLSSKSSYIVEAVSATDHFSYLVGTNDLVEIPKITYVGSKFSTATTLSYPTSEDGSTGFFGGNFLNSPLHPGSGPDPQPTPDPGPAPAPGVDPSPVPEPGPLALGGGLAVTGLLWRRRLRRARAAQS